MQRSQLIERDGRTLNHVIVGQSPPNPPYVLRSRRGFADFYVYALPAQLDFTPGQALFSSESDVFVFDSDADFELQRLSAWTDSADTDYTQYTSQYAQVNINIRDNATGRLLFGDYVSMAELFGLGRTPFVLPTTHFFKRGTSATILYSPIDPGPDFENFQVFPFLIGRKHFDY